MQLVVLGMHRSGTSAVTRLLNMMGAYFGPEGVSTGANEENPKGFWERRDVRLVCDTLLKSTDRDWWAIHDFDATSVPPAAQEAALAAFGQVVRDMDAHRPWVVKEPRLCLLLPVLRPALEMPVCVLVHRDPLEVAMSLQARNGFPLSFGIALWEVYTVSALRASAGLPQVLVSHAALMADPVTTVKDLHTQLAALEVEGLRLPGSREITAFIDPSLHRQRASADQGEHLNVRQAALVTAMADGSILGAEVPGLSGGGAATLEQFERATQQAAHDTAERARRTEREAEAAQETSELHEEVTTLRSYVEALRARLEESDSALDERDTALIKAQEVVADAQTAIALRDSALLEHEAAMRGRDAALEQATAALDTLRSESAQHVGRLQEAVETAQRELKAVEAEAQERADVHEHDATALQQFAVAAECDLDMARITLNEQEQALEAIGGELDRLRETADEAQRDQEATRTALQDKEQSLELLTGELEAVTRQLADAQAELTGTVETLAERDQLLQRLRSEAGQQRKAVDSASVQQKRLTAELDAAAGREQELRRSLEEMDTQRAGAVALVRASELGRRAVEEETRRLADLVDELGVALMEREAHLHQLQRALDRAADHTERLAAARAWRVARGLATASSTLRFRRSRWDAPKEILRRLNAVPQTQLSALPSLDRQVRLSPLPPPSLESAQALAPPNQRAVTAPPRKAPDAADLEEARLVAEADLCTRIAGRMDEPIDRRPLGPASEPTGWPLEAVHDRALSHGPSVDVIVCVHNAAEDVARCLASLTAKTTRSFRLIVVDDGSAEPTRALLAEHASRWPQTTVLRNAEAPHGYTIAANMGLRASTADFVVLLNSDTVVTHGWLEHLLEVAFSSDRIGIVGPLSNAATHQSVPQTRQGGEWAVNAVPSWMTPDAMAYLVGRLSVGPPPRLPFLNGFCFGVRREVIDAVGLLDEETFAAGYGEESDYAMRARAAGFELAVVDTAYVFHAKSKSYGGAEGRRKLAKAHYQALLRKHGEDNVQTLVRQMESDQALTPLRTRVAQATTSFEGFRSTFSALVSNPLRVLFVVPGVSHGSSGGVHSIYQEVGGMRALGVDARVAAPSRARDRAVAAYHDADAVFTFYDSFGELQGIANDYDVVVATHYATVPIVADLRRSRHFLAAYYIQDYEPFFADERSELRDAALASFTELEHAVLFAKTEWLCSTVAARHGLRVAKVEPSIDRQTYNPAAGTRDPSKVRVVGMVRPRTPRRQPMTTYRLLHRLQAETGDDVQVEVFGCTDDDLAALAPASVGGVYNHGVLARAQVAGVLASADVFVDLSVYQAFGRTALEAMACGATALVPQVGGCGEFAVDGENCLVVDTADPSSALDALAGLLADVPRLRAAQAAAFETAQRYSVERAALSEYMLMRHWHRKQDHRP